MGDPAPLPYLYDAEDQREGSFSVEVEMHLLSAKMRGKDASWFSSTFSTSTAAAEDNVIRHVIRPSVCEILNRTGEKILGVTSGATT